MRPIGPLVAVLVVLVVLSGTLLGVRSFRNDDRAPERVVLIDGAPVQEDEP